MQTINDDENLKNEDDLKDEDNLMYPARSYTTLVVFAFVYLVICYPKQRLANLSLTRITSINNITQKAKQGGLKICMMTSSFFSHQTNCKVKSVVNLSSDFIYPGSLISTKMYTIKLSLLEIMHEMTWERSHISLSLDILVYYG